jgi:exportin-5
MRDLMSKPKVVAHSAGDSSAVNSLSTGSGQADSEKRKILDFLNDDIFSAILDISFQRMLKREKVLPGTEHTLGALELWSDDFEGRGDFGQYRGRLVCITCLGSKMSLFFTFCIMILFFSLFITCYSYRLFSF